MKKQLKTVATAELIQDKHGFRWHLNGNWVSILYDTKEKACFPLASRSPLFQDITHCPRSFERPKEHYVLCMHCGFREVLESYAGSAFDAFCSHVLGGHYLHTNGRCRGNLVIFDHFPTQIIKQDLEQMLTKTIKSI